MNDYDDIPEEFTDSSIKGSDRVNGFAPGDRVAIVNCELAGAYGKVTRSRGGCWDDCRDICRLVFVNLIKRPKDVEVLWHRETYADPDPNTLKFLVNEVVHVD